jgi:hypothetical protein
MKSSFVYKACHVFWSETTQRWSIPFLGINDVSSANEAKTLIDKHYKGLQDSNDC